MMRASNANDGARLGRARASFRRWPLAVDKYSLIAYSPVTQRWTVDPLSDDVQAVPGTDINAEFTLTGEPVPHPTAVSAAATVLRLTNASFTGAGTHLSYPGGPPYVLARNGDGVQTVLGPIEEDIPQP